MKLIKMSQKTGAKKAAKVRTKGIFDLTSLAKYFFSFCQIVDNIECLTLSHWQNVFFFLLSAYLGIDNIKLLVNHSSLRAENKRKIRIRFLLSGPLDPDP